MHMVYLEQTYVLYLSVGAGVCFYGACVNVCIHMSECE